METNTRTQIFYHSPALFDRAIQAKDGSQGVVCCILCAAAVEAFLHDLVEWYKFSFNHNAVCKAQREMRPPLFGKKRNITCVSELHQFSAMEESIFLKLSIMENMRIPIQNKYNELHRSINGDYWSKNDNTYRNFLKLIKIRNAIVHLKGFSVVTELKEETSHGLMPIDQYPSFIKDFYQKKLLKPYSRRVSWIELLESRQFCEWCLDTAKIMIDAVLDQLPKTYVSSVFVNGVRW